MEATEQDVDQVEARLKSAESTLASAGAVIQETGLPSPPVCPSKFLPRGCRWRLISLNELRLHIPCVRRWRRSRRDAAEHGGGATP
jgi:hypothetical protein